MARSESDRRYGARFQEDIVNLRALKPEQAAQIEDMLWIADGIQGEEEYRAARGLIELADSGHLPKFTEEPWVVEGRNYAALQNLASSNISFDPPEVFNWVVDHPALNDGISDREAKILAALAVPSDASNLDPDAVVIEERTITLPLAGVVELTIIWTSPGPHTAMDMLESALRRIEATMGLPFPRRQVIYKIEPDGPQFGYYGDTYVHLSGYRTHSQLKGTVAHEAAHYYWSWPVASWASLGVNHAWVSEGAAEFLTHLDEDITYGVEPGSVCDLNLIPEVEQLPFDGPKCWYQIGHRFYLDLYRAMDETNFRLAFRRWFLHTLHATSVCDGDGTTYCRVMEAFTTYASEDNRATVEDLINRWYGVTS